MKLTIYMNFYIGYFPNSIKKIDNKKNNSEK